MAIVYFNFFAGNYPAQVTGLILSFISLVALFGWGYAFKHTI
eukprot:UN17734